MKKLAIFIVSMVLALSLTLSAIPVYAVPALPHAFYGTVEINGSSAPVGTRVEARGTGVMTGIEDNPTITTVSGIYGTSNPFEHRLIVQGDIDDGATITFYVNGRSTGLTAEWHSGETTDLALSVTISAPSRPPPPTVETTLFGVAGEFSIDDEGVIQETIAATSEAGDFTITIPEGTIALDIDGDPLSTLTIELDLDPPDPPEDAYIIGIPYKLGPPGATFVPPITIEFTVDPATLPPGIDVEDLVIAYYDEVAGEWVELPTTYDPATNTFTASVTHFTTFAVISVVTLPEEEEVITPPVEEEEEEEEEVITPPVEEEEEEEEEIITPPVEEEEEVVTLPIAEEGWPWWTWLLIGLGSAVAIGLLVFFFVRRRAY